MAKDGEEELDAVLARAQAAVSELAKSYGTWAMADLDRCRGLLDEARADSVMRPAKLAELYGIAHNIKGQGSSFGYPLMTQIGQSLCVFTRPAHEQQAGQRSGQQTAARVFDDRDLGVVQSHLDAMRLILEKQIRGDGGEIGRKLAQRLETLVREAQG